jgi:outer membrane protein OmpA-like peptidoglycan-associated protein
MLRYDERMRCRLPAVAVVILLLAASSVAVAEDVVQPRGGVPLQTPQRRALEVRIDRAKVDLDHHRLEVKLSRAADKVTLKVIGESGATLAEVEKPFKGAAAGTPLEIGWSPSSDEAVTKIEVWGYDTDGYYAGVAIVPWKASVPHQEVAFQTDSDVIGAAEVPKLQASLATIRELAKKRADLGKVTLYVLGHTDTVGSAEHNLGLSRRRARAIAAWFKSRGLALAIAYEGLGERSPLVKTPDETDEPRNRRVDYILALEPPALPSAEFSWKSP